ncbi:MAG: hypothetical protein OH338_05105 [Candidatus Parvarchaeota archaeon]|nr:hypothetical protein [Candidatus Parvarchaeum tengchongense]
MAIMVIIGELGSGKTLSLTYLLWRNWYYKNKIIYANYTLYGIPYFKITKVSELDMIRQGYLGADEMWVWLETSVGERLKKKIVSDILRKSRKRNLTINSTSQTLEQIPLRIRKIIDFIGYPMLNRNATICRLAIFSGPHGRTLLKEHYFYTAPVFKMYDTNEEIGDLIDDVTPTWKKAISPQAQKRYTEKFIMRAQPQQQININPREIEIEIKKRKENLTLEEVQDEGFRKEEEKEIIERAKELEELNEG